MRIPRRRTLSVRACCALLTVVTAVAAAPPGDGGRSDGRKSPEATDAPRFVLSPEMPYRAHLRATGIFLNAFHLTRPTGDVVADIKAKADPPPVTVIICRGPQENAIRDFRDVADRYIFEALFLQPDWQSPDDDGLIWPGCDHPMINYVRRIRRLTADKPAIASVPMTCREVWGVPRKRPELFDELLWMTMAVIGADYDGILWGHVRREPEWNRLIERLTARLKVHAADLPSAEPVDWVSAPAGQPVSALASEGKLYITLLNTDFMKISKDRKRLTGALQPGRRSGDLTLRLPEGVSAGDGETLAGSPVRLTRDADSVRCPYDFSAGGELIVLPIDRPEPVAATSRPVGDAVPPGDADPPPDSDTP